MVRDRLEELQLAAKHAPLTPEQEENEMEPLKKKREKEKKKREQKPGGGGGGEDNDDMQDFLERFELTVRHIEKVEANVESVDRLHKKLLTAPHKDEADERQLEDLMAENKRLAQTVRSALKTEQEQHEKRAKKASGLTAQEKAELRVRRTQVNAQSRRFYDIWEHYSGGQVEYRDKSKKLLVKRCKITNNSFTDEQIETMLDEGNTAVFAKSILDQEQMARQQLSELQDRHDEFIKLEKSIVEIHDMFVEVANLVAQQGEMVDTIHANVINAEADVEKGRVDLSKAEKFRNSARKWKVCLCLVGVVILLVFILVILIELGVFSGSSDNVR